MSRKNTKHRNREQWREIIAAQEASGQSVSAYCRGKDFSDKSFYVWRKRLRSKTVIQPGKFLEVTPSTRNQEQQNPLYVSTPKGYRLEVPCGIDEDMLRMALRALESV